MPERPAKSNNKRPLDSAKLKRFRWRRFLVFLAIFLILIYLLSLLILNSSWAKNKLTDRLRDKTNSEWELGSALWIPFGVIELNNLQTKMGEGGITIKSISVKPSWNQLISGVIQINEARVSGADVDLDLKWLAENRRNVDDTIVFPQENIESQPNETHHSQSSQPQQPQQPTENPLAKKPTTTPAPEKNVIESDLNEAHNSWLKLEKLNLTVRRGEKVIDIISNLSASIPISGKPTNGEIKFEFYGDQHIQKIVWDSQELSVEETAGKFLSANFQWRAACRINQLGMPFAFQFIIPPQKFHHQIDKPNFHLSVTSEKIAANFILRGGLKNPHTWQGLFNAISEKTMITESQKTHKQINFDYTRFAASLSNNTIHIPVAEAIGDQSCILANGFVHKNLYSYGTVRIIVNPESAGIFESLYHGSKFVQIDHSYHFLAPLDTPDRLYCDLYFDGKLTDLEIRHNRGDHWQSLNIAIKKILEFKNNELKEDGLLEAE